MQWFEYPIISRFGETDREGDYWQPDANIGCPLDGFPVTALLDGVVSSVQHGTSWGQDVITIRLKTPLNRKASHIFYEHLGDTTVSSGQVVKSGDLIGHTASSSVGILLGFGLYSGDVYGSGQAWTVLQDDIRPGGEQLLNPTELLNDARAGKTYVPNYNGTSDNSSSSSDFITETGVWIAKNIFKIPNVVVGVNDTPWKLLGGVILTSAVIALVAAFILLVGI